MPRIRSKRRWTSTRWLIACFAVVLLNVVGTSEALAPPWGGRSQEYPAGNRQETGRPENYVRRSAFLPSPPVNQARQPDTNTEQNPAEKKWWYYPQWVLARIKAQWVIAIATIVYAFYAARQWSAIRQQAEATRQQAEATRQQAGTMTEMAGTGKVSATAAEKGADAAHRYAEIAADTAKRQLRAYIHIHKATMMLSKIAPDMHQCHLVIRNYGQTPAYNMRKWVKVWIGPYPLAGELPGLPEEPSVEKTILPPNDTDNLWLNIEAPLLENSVGIGGRQRTIYVYGKFCYTDAFNAEWFTRFRIFYGGETGVVPEGIMQHYPDGNEAT